METQVGFPAGSLVRLRSGGPTMTVGYPDTIGAERNIPCTRTYWVNEEGVAQNALIPNVCLVGVEPLLNERNSLGIPLDDMLLSSRRKALHEEADRLSQTSAVWFCDCSSPYKCVSIVEAVCPGCGRTRVQAIQDTPTNPEVGTLNWNTTSK